MFNISFSKRESLLEVFKWTFDVVFRHFISPPSSLSQVFQTTFKFICGFKFNSAFSSQPQIFPLNFNGYYFVLFSPLTDTYLTENFVIFTGIIQVVNIAEKVSVFGVILVAIFPHSDWIRRDAEYLSVFNPNAGK